MEGLYLKIALRGQDTVIRSFKIGKKLLEELEKFARKKSMSTNRLLNNILNICCEPLFYADYYGFVGFSRAAFEEFVNSVPDEILTKAAKDAVAAV